MSITKKELLRKIDENDRRLINLTDEVNKLKEIVAPLFSRITNLNPGGIIDENDILGKNIITVNKLLDYFNLKLDSYLVDDPKLIEIPKVKRFRIVKKSNKIK